MKVVEETDAHSVDKAILLIKEKEKESCCKQQCIKNLLEKNDESLRKFLEEWLQLDKVQRELVLRFTIRIFSHWSVHTVRGVNRTLSRFEFEDPILGRLCRKAFSIVIDVGEATLSRHVAAVHASGGDFIPSAHGNKGQKSHRQIDLSVRREVINFFLEIASVLGEESPGRHSLREEEKKTKSTADTRKESIPIVFLPSMYSLRFLYHLYREKVKHGCFPAKYHISWAPFYHVFHSEELRWLRIRSPRDDVCDVCSLYRVKMLTLLREQGTRVTLEKLGGISSELVQHRDLAIKTRKMYQEECKKATEVAEIIQESIENGSTKTKLEELLLQYEAHYSFGFSQSLWLPQMADTPGKFYFLSLRSINLFGIVDDGGTGSPLQTNMLYDQTTANKGSSEVVSMLYHFLIHRNSAFASRTVRFHADNCVGQNKNSTMIHFFLWCIATGMLDHIELKFMLKGHTKFSPDAGFGLIKKQYRRSNVYTIEQVAGEIKRSTHETKRNDAVILKKEDFGNWKSVLENFFISLKGISGFSIFIFDRKYPIGEVHVRKHNDKKSQVRKLLKPKLRPEEVLRTISFTEMRRQLPPLEQSQIQAKKQWDLYEKVRPYVPDEYQDIICPKPNVDKSCSNSK